jgi:hypothetical protein
MPDYLASATIPEPRLHEAQGVGDREKIKPFDEPSGGRARKTTSRSIKRGDRIAVIVCAVALVAAAVLGYFVAGWMFGTH